MGMIARALGLGQAARSVGGAVEGVAEVFTVNKTKSELAARRQTMASLNEYGAEFVNAGHSWFDSFINGINRLPRPVMALGVVGLFIFAMVNPDNFARRMEGLAYIPDPLWWLLGAVVSFYFGAREMHYAREGRPPQPGAVPLVFPPARHDAIQASFVHDGNAALDEWRQLHVQA